MRLELVQNLSQNTAIQTTNDSQHNIALTVEAISELAKLEYDWDSYGALPPTKDACIGSVQLAYELLKANTPVPDVFPVPNGNIQFEWSCFGYDIEIEIESNRKCQVNFENLESGENWESEFTYDLSSLSRLIDDLTERSIAEERIRLVN
jgi:hypothetical protein